MSKENDKEYLVRRGGQTAYGFYPQMKPENMCFSKELSGCIVIGTNPGFHNGVVIIKDDEDTDNIK